jgi:hypothetical protein
MGWKAVSSAEVKRIERFSEKLFVTLITEVSLISREPNLRFERISISSLPSLTKISASQEIFSFIQ